MAGLTLAEAQWRAQEWREWRHERAWRVPEYLDQPLRRLGLGQQPAQAPVHLDPEAPMLLRHVREARARQQAERRAARQRRQQCLRRFAAFTRALRRSRLA